jgi:hypothetical protein
LETDASQSPARREGHGAAGGRVHGQRTKRASTFARGLALGALVGAAIAGSTIWQRRHDGRTPPTSSTERSPNEPDGSPPP